MEKQINQLIEKYENEIKACQAREKILKQKGNADPSNTKEFLYADTQISIYCRLFVNDLKLILKEKGKSNG
jgi:hypothetical protein